jgi:predicted amidophosphoribosyltransferase
VINVDIVGFVAWRLSRAFIRPDPAAPATRVCPSCRMNVDPSATRCAYCTSTIEPLAQVAARAAG